MPYRYQIVSTVLFVILLNFNPIVYVLSFYTEEKVLNGGQTPQDQNMLAMSAKSNAFYKVLQYEDYYHRKKRHIINTEIKHQMGVHESVTYFTIEFEGMQYHIDLTLNEELFPSNYGVTSFSSSGEKIISKPNSQNRDHCYYHGVLRGVANSTVVANTCHGLEGYISLPNDFLVIRPLPNNRYKIFRPDNFNNDSIWTYCGNKSGLKEADHLIEIHLDPYIEQEIHSREGSDKKFLELMLVADHATFKKYSSLKTLENHIKALTHLVDSHYTHFGVRVVLSHIEIWNTGDKITMSPDADVLLKTFSNYRRQKLLKDPDTSPWVYADAVHLICGYTFSSVTLGTGYVKGMCTSQAVGVGQDQSDPFRIAGTVTHELGHNFGMKHVEDYPNCACPRRTECIMAAGATFTYKLVWSPCSIATITKGLNEGLGNCLYNIPDTRHTVLQPRCGNDIVEDGEECDCGFPEACKSECCNANTCKFTHGSVCDIGACCSNCQLVKKGVECRPTTDECDFSEYCDGKSPQCPENSYKEDETACLQDQASCIGGVCLTLDVVCENTWGKGAYNAKDACYNVINMQGREYGNCGRSRGGGYKKCAPQDVKCGSLFCIGGKDLPLTGSKSAKITLGALSCKAYSGNRITPRFPDFGLVENGTTCGPRKICRNIKCETVSESTCSAMCNGNGICNNFHQCHCDVGWAPPNCTQVGFGGSKLSGYPISIYTGGDIMALIATNVSTMLITLFLLIVCLRTFHHPHEYTRTPNEIDYYQH